MYRALFTLLWVLSPALVQAQEVCARAQAVIAQTNLQPAVVVHRQWDAFVTSKPTDEPFQVQQFFSSHLEGENSPDTVVSCKLRTAERINAAHDVAGSDAPAAGVQSSCDAFQRDILDEIYRVVPPDNQLITRERWLIAEEERTYIGPRWLEPWPFVPLTRLPDGRLQLHSKALYVPYAWWIPMPERFLGNYYCHLAAPSYLESLVRGEVI